MPLLSGEKLVYLRFFIRRDSFGPIHGEACRIKWYYKYLFKSGPSEPVAAKVNFIVRLSTYTDFGLRTLMYLATLPEGRLSCAAEVSAVYNISLNHLVKVAGQLKKLGYLEATRGKNGGIRLAIAARDINVGHVIRQLETHLDGVDCSSSSCQLLSVCRLRQALALAMEDFLNVMDSYTLADLIANKEQLVPLFSDSDPFDLAR